MKWALAVLCLLVTAFLPVASAAPVCLTGNDPQGHNAVLPDACYQFYWAGTYQPKHPTDTRFRGWVPFSEGALTNGRSDEMDYVNSYTKAANLYTYSWGPDDYDIEVDLGRVCEVTSVTLEASSKWIRLKVFYPGPRRWLPVAEGENTVVVTGLRCSRFRIEAGNCRPAPRFSELRVWGTPLDAQSTPSWPAPQQPPIETGVFTPLALKPSSAPLVAPDPFIFPNPQEMALGNDRLKLSAPIILLLPADAPPAIADAANLLAGNLSMLTGIESRCATTAETAAITLGLPDTPGNCAAVAARRQIAGGNIPSEGYAMEISADGATLVGVDAVGLLNATRSFALLARPDVDGGISVPLGHVRDFPRETHRPVFGYGGWRTDFKLKVLALHALFKANTAHGNGTEAAYGIMSRNRMARVLPAAMYPGSACGTGGDMLEVLPGMKRLDLDVRRLSACCSHANFWPGMFRAFPAKESDPLNRFVDLSHDEIMHNPWMVCPRCRARGLTQREMLADNFLKAYRYLTARKYGVVIYATGFQYVSKAFDMFLDIPTEGVIAVNYDRRPTNQVLRDRGFTTVAGNTKAFPLIEGESAHSSLVWFWGTEDRINLISKVLPDQLMQDEENWSSLKGKPEVYSPEWYARQNRVRAIAQAVLDGVPLEPPGTVREYFTVDITAQANRSLTDDVWGDGAGWLDEGPARDLRHLPTGRQTLGGIPYLIGSGPAAAIIVAGPGAADRAYPDQVCGIPVRRKASRLLFLHTCSRSIWTNYLRSVVLLGFYRIRYADDTCLAVPVNYRQHLLEWRRDFGYRKTDVEPNASPVGDAGVAWRGSTESSDDVTLYSMPWTNPYPEKEIASIDVLASAQMESNANHLCLLAVSGVVPMPGDNASAAKRTGRPSLRTYRPRPELAQGTVSLDMTRRTLHPPLAGATSTTAASWKTSDNWFQATANRAICDGREYSLGVYSALDPDDDTWRGASEESRKQPSEFTLRFKRALPLRGFGVKGAMQRVSVPGIFPMDFQVDVIDEDGNPRPFATVAGHVGQEGEERWIWPKETLVGGLRIRISSGSGISSISLYARPDAIESVRREAAEKVDDLFKGKKLTNEDVRDALEGI